MSIGKISQEFGALQLLTPGEPAFVLKWTLLDVVCCAMTSVTFGMVWLNAVVSVRKRQAAGNWAPVGWPVMNVDISGSGSTKYWPATAGALQTHAGSEVTGSVPPVSCSLTQLVVI